MFNIYGSHFFGNKISDYGIKNGRVDYATLAKAFDAVLSNNIISDTYEIGYWEQCSGFIDNSDQIAEIEEKIEELEELITMDSSEEEDARTTTKIEELEEQKEELENEQDYCPEIFQYYIVSDSGAEILEECNEIVFYNDTLNLYVWGVTHWGTSWDYVLTDIPCNTGNI